MDNSKTCSELSNKFCTVNPVCNIYQNTILAQDILESINRFNTILCNRCDIDTSDVDTLDTDYIPYSKDDIDVYYKPITYRVIDRFITI